MATISNQKYEKIAIASIDNALVAQWIEHPPPKGRVARSIRVEGTIKSITYKNILVKIFNCATIVQLIPNFRILTLANF